MHGCMTENNRKIKIKLKYIWIDLMGSIYAPYMFMMENIENNTRYERVMCQVKENLVVEGNTLSVKVAEATEMLNKATAAANAVVRLFHQVTGDAVVVSAILGVRPYTAIIRKWGRCGYLPAVKHPSRYLCPSSESSIDVNDHNEML